MGKFILTSEYKPTGDQPEAIRELTEGLDRGDRAQVLLGVTGSGKTFTMANVIAQHNRPTLILSHNKTLAHQLYMEMKEFFPQNAVEYYVSYYDYYQPEAYLPSRDLYMKEGTQHQRRDRQTQALSCIQFAFRKKRRRRHFFCFLHLWYGQSCCPAGERHRNT